MRIAIDARMMGPLHTRGPGRYIEELIRALLEQIPEGWRFVLFEKDPSRSPFAGHPCIEHVSAPIPWYGWQEQWKMPRLFKEAKADLVHVPFWNVPLAYRGPLVVTIHDLLLRHQPESAKASTRHPFVALAKRLGYRIALSHAIKQASHILVPTEFVARDVRRFFPASVTKIRVTGEGLASFPEPDTRLCPKRPFLFYVGSAYPHKRLDLLLDVWKDFKPRHPDFCLVIAGENDLFMQRIARRATQETLSDVLFPGRIREAELAGFFDRAAAFVFPSSHEGFGLPPIEALSRGCPVVSSNSSCLPEVLPTSGVFFFRDGDKDAMIQAIENLLTQGERAQEAARCGGEDVRRRHQWKEAAKKTLASYEGVLYPSHGPTPSTKKI